MSLFCRSLFVILYFFFWPLCCVFFFDLQILITPLVAVGYCVVCSSSIYRFWLPLWYLHTLLNIGKYGKMLVHLLLLNGLNSTTMIIRRNYKIFIYFILIGQKKNKRPSPVIIVLHCTCITLGRKLNLYALFAKIAVLMKPNCAWIIIAWCLKDKRGRRGRDL